MKIIIIYFYSNVTIVSILMIHNYYMNRGNWQLSKVHYITIVYYCDWKIRNFKIYSTNQMVNQPIMTESKSGDIFRQIILMRTYCRIVEVFGQ